MILFPQYLGFWDIIISIIGSGIWGILFTSLVWNNGLIFKWQAESQ